MLRLAINLENVRAARYAAAAGRVAGVEVVSDEAGADAVVSTRPGDGGGRPLLLVPTDSSFGEARSRGFVMPAAPWRFRPAVAAIHRRLAAGHLGPPGLLRIHRWGGPADPLADVDLAGWIFADDPLTAHVMSQSDTGCRQIHLGYRDGGMAVIDHAPLPGPACYESLTLIGSAGAAYHDDHHNTNLLYTRDGCTGLRVTEEDQGLVALLREFVAAITEGRPPAVTLRELQPAADWVRHHLA